MNILKNRRLQLIEELRLLKNADAAELPLGKEVIRRETIVKAAVEAADELIMDFGDGSAEETNLLTAEVAGKLLEKVIHPLRSELMRRDLRHE